MNALINWYSIHKRPLPWREDPSPYHVWLSEIILQQTRVIQGLPYYYRFIERFPDISILSNASETEVLRLWEGLGYYSRARNLHTAAKQVVNDFGGQFPERYQDLLKLKGVGVYTAAAIASICFKEAVPVIDGNVYRVISRLYGLDHDISIPATRKVFQKVLEQLIPPETPGDFNQALMELGALTCTPKSPSCEQCPLPLHCFAFEQKRQSKFPVKKAKPKVKSRFFHYLVIQHGSHIGMRQRDHADIWKGLFEFGLVENGPDPLVLDDHLDISFDVNACIGPIKHVLTHRHIHARFYHISIKSEVDFRKVLNSYKLTPVSVKDIVTLPKSKLIVNFLTEINL